MRLSKSAVLCYRQCPHKYKLSYVDKLPQPKHPVLERGIEIHELADKFFDYDTPDEAYDKLVAKNPKHKKAIESIKSFAIKLGGKEKFFKPFLKEQKYHEPELDFSGVIDAVFVDNGDVLVLDYKTGQVHELEKYYYELSMYRYLLEKLGIIQRVTHLGIYFIDHGIMKVAEASDEALANAVAETEATRWLIEKGKFEKCPSELCKWCGYYGKECDGR